MHTRFSGTNLTRPTLVIEQK